MPKILVKISAGPKLVKLNPNTVLSNTLCTYIDENLHLPPTQSNISILINIKYHTHNPSPASYPIPSPPNVHCKQLVSLELIKYTQRPTILQTFSPRVKLSIEIELLRYVFAGYKITHKITKLKNSILKLNIGCGQ